MLDGWRGKGGYILENSHMSSNLFDFMVDNIIDAGFRLELCHGRVWGGEVEPLGAGLEVGLQEGTPQLGQTGGAMQRAGGLLLQYLHKNVLHYLDAVIVHTYVTGEGLTQENISVWCREVEKSDLFTSKQTGSDWMILQQLIGIYYPKFCGNVSISPSIKASAPLMVDGSSLMSWSNRSPTEGEHTVCIQPLLMNIAQHHYPWARQKQFSQQTNRTRNLVKMQYGPFQYLNHSKHGVI